MARAIDAYTLNNDLVSWYNDTEDEKEKSILRRVMQRVVQAPTITPPNEPLTLEQLRQMDGEPAYIPETNCWVLVTKNPFVPLFTWPDGEQCSAYDWYAQVGPAYRRPPEGEA